MIDLNNLYQNIYTNQENECADKMIDFLKGMSYNDAVSIVECIKVKLELRAKIT
jgi:hypothetical protein